MVLPISTSRAIDSCPDLLEAGYSIERFGRLKDQQRHDNRTGRNGEMVEMSAFLSFFCLRFSFAWDSVNVRFFSS